MRNTSKSSDDAPILFGLLEGQQKNRASGGGRDLHELPKNRKMSPVESARESQGCFRHPEDVSQRRGLIYHQIPIVVEGRNLYEVNRDVAKKRVKYELSLDRRAARDTASA